MLSKTGTEERSWRGECLADGTNSISAVSATVRRRCAGRGRIWSNQAGDTSETKILITSGLEICLRIGRVPGTRDRVSNETKQTRHLPPPPFGLLSQSGRGCTPPRSKRDPRRVRTAAANVIKPREIVALGSNWKLAKLHCGTTGWNRASTLSVSLSPSLYTEL